MSERHYHQTRYRHPENKQPKTTKWDRGKGSKAAIEKVFSIIYTDFMVVVCGWALKS